MLEDLPPYAELRIYDMNKIDEAFNEARAMGGSGWPSADSTRWALERLGRNLADRVELLAKEGFRAGEMKREVLRSCGLLPANAQK